MKNISREHYTQTLSKTYARYFLSFNNVKLTVQWLQIRNLVCKLDQYPGYDDGICVR